MKIVIPQLVYAKVMHWVDKANGEVSGFGTVKYNAATQSFDVVDAYLLKQEGGASHTDIDAAALAKLMYTTRNDEGDLKWWWHSHVNMDVFWSTTDTTTIKDLGKHGWAVATVFNKRHETRSAVCYVTKSDFSELVEYKDNIPTEVLSPALSEEIIAAWDAEFTENVTENKYTPYGGNYYSYSDWQKEKEEARAGARTAKEKDMEWYKDYQQKNKEINSQASTRAVTPTLLDTEGWDPGLTGWGLMEEAATLKMAVGAYRNLLATASNETINALTRKLDTMIQGDYSGS